jgi:Protein of unknown function (DUF2637)
VRAHGEAGWTARLVPLTVDGLIYASSMVMLDSARRKTPVPPLARWLLSLGVAATPGATLDCRTEMDQRAARCRGRLRYGLTARRSRRQPARIDSSSSIYLRALGNIWHRSLLRFCALWHVDAHVIQGL